MKFELTEKALRLDLIVVQHKRSGDFLLDGYATIKEACESVLQSRVSNVLEIDQYNYTEVHDAHRMGHAWPVALGLIEEL